MKKGFYKKSNALMRFTAWVVVYAFLMLPSGVAFAGNPVPLSQVPVPTPPNLGDFVKDKAAAIRLGKALFWDMNVGGDGVQACASCHYRAGADPYDVRSVNQVNPGPNGNSNTVSGPNQTLTAADFPFVQVQDPGNPNTRLQNGLIFTNEKDDVFGSQGVGLHIFNNIVFGNPADNGSAVSDPTFGTSRRVTGRNTPPAVNAVFNYANFWDGRANNIFNGSSPLGPLDASAGIWVNTTPTDSPTLVFQKIALPNASLASQAVGPPNNNTEMSWDGRNFPQLGRKLLNNGLVPLGQQLVSKNDSMLGALSNAPANGINTTYTALIETAFYEKYWNSFAPNIVINGTSYSQMEANFSLFWGLSIMLYESTLVSDQTPFDLYLGGATSAMTDTQVKGFGIFQSKCAMCHSGSELSDATVSNALANGLLDKGVTNAGGAISDIGYANLGVSPTSHDIGRGGIGGSPNPIASFAGEAIAQANGTLAFTAPQAIFDGITASTPVAVNGSFKTPMLRNVALTAPYMHNGSMLTLAEVVDFYARGGNYANAEQAKEINQPVGLSADDRAALVDFLQNALTDPRAAAESAPFDHPELRIPDGTTLDSTITRAVTGNNDFDPIANLLGKPAETTTLAALPKAEITSGPSGLINSRNATITVGGTGVINYQYTLDGAASGAISSVATPISLTGLADGAHTVSVTGIDAAGHTQPASNQTAVAWTVKATPPAVGINPIEATSRNTSQTVSGTMEAGSTVTVRTDTGAAGGVTVSGSTWTCQLSGLAKGNNTITVTATDAAGNVQTATTVIKVVIADGCFRGTGSPDITDALKALKMSVGIITPTNDDMLHGDVNVNNKMDSGDALLILKKSVGMASF